MIKTAGNLVKEEKTNNIKYWKISPGEGAWNWVACRDGGFIGMGWDEFGDISKMNRPEFDRRRDELLEEHKNEVGWSKNGLEQLWRFAHISEGDRIIANWGTKKVLGIGTVKGLYYYVPNERHRHRIPVEWNDTTLHNVDEGGWRRTLIEINRKKFESIYKVETRENVVEPISESQFSVKTFELLDKLHNNPTSKYYYEHKEDFKKEVEERFQQLFHNVAARLPIQITDLMETENRIFAKIPKNDYGRGGAWDFYWGAFYPKNGKRIEDAQLFMWLNRERLEFGFYIGKYGGDQRKRFLRNCQENQEMLISLLEDNFAQESLVYGKCEDLIGGTADSESPSHIATWKEWLIKPEEKGIHVAVILSKDKVLQISSEQLVGKIVQTFGHIFPLVLLATSNKPMSAIGEYLEPLIDEAKLNPDYSLSKCAEETSLDETLLSRWVSAIERKGQAILYGPPGTGKTFLAEKLAKHLISAGDGFIELIQFHPAYAYEDFIQGIRPQPQDNGDLIYPMVPGRFLDFCKRASFCKGSCVLIIDEINRADLSRVFGELMYLLEYRNLQIPLAGGEFFKIPENVRVVGTMNTADRSIALVDHALRRRFAFLALYPNYDVLRKFHEETDFPIDGLIEILERLNKKIGDRHYEIGITFFLRKDLTDHIEDIWQMEIIPYLEEYFFDQSDKVDEFRWDKIREKVSP